MHYRLLVTVNKDVANTSEEARDYVHDELMEDASFVGEGGRFNSPVADWFVIGGRWSGELSRETFLKDVIAQVEKMEKDADIQIWGCHYGDEKKTKQQAELKEKVEKLYQEALPKEYQGKGLVYDRDTYNQLGFEDDAMLLTQELYDALLKKYTEDGDKGEYSNEGDHVSYNQSWGEDLCYVDLDYDTLSPDMIGKKWLVVVDYHN